MNKSLVYFKVTRGKLLNYPTFLNKHSLLKHVFIYQMEDGPKPQMMLQAQKPI